MNDLELRVWGVAQALARQYAVGDETSNDNMKLEADKRLSALASCNGHIIDSAYLLQSYDQMKRQYIRQPF